VVAVVGVEPTIIPPGGGAFQILGWKSFSMGIHLNREPVSTRRGSRAIASMMESAQQKFLGNLETPRNPFEIASNKDMTLLGISFSIYGNDFDLYMLPPPPLERKEFWYRCRIYRWRAIEGGVWRIHLGWDGAPPSFEGKIAAIDRKNPKDPLLKG